MFFPTAKTHYILLVSLLILSCSKEEIAITDGPDIIVQLPNTNSNTEKTEVVTNEILWIKSMQSSNGLIASTEDTDFVSLYDNALAALVFIEVNEFSKAEGIFDFFNSKLDSEFLEANGGFYQSRTINDHNGSRKWIGDNAWLLIALNKYQETTGKNTYQTMAEQIENWLRDLQDTDGGLWGGYNQDGTKIPKITEGIITAFNAVKGYDDFHKNILTFIKENRWDPNDKILLAWPENPTYNHALDLHSLGGLIFKEFSADNLFAADRFLNTQTSTVNGLDIEGYCFDEDKDVVWLEGTAQMAVAFQTLKNEENAEKIITELEKSLINSTAIETAKGLPYTANHGTSFGSTALWDHADLTPTISTTAWYIFSRIKANPMALGLNKEIPAKDSFWITD